MKISLYFLFLLFIFFINSVTKVTLNNLKVALDKQGNSMKQDEPLMNILSSWIQQRSLSGNETSVQLLIQQELIKLGLETILYEIDIEEMQKNQYFFSKRNSFKSSPNLIGILKGKHGEDYSGNISIDSSTAQQSPINNTSLEGKTTWKSIILNGHVDVVHEGDGQWKHGDPYSGYNDGKRIYGRGSTDMKGGIFSSLLALKMLRNLAIQLDGDVIFQSVVEEESGGAGTLSTVIKGYKADAAIIPEPTQLKIFPKQQGSMWFRIHVFGLSAHGGTRYEGVSAIEKSVIVIDAIRKLEEVRNARVKESDPFYANLTIPIPINIGVIQGGKWPSSVPDLVTLEGRIGVAPSETLEIVREELRNSLMDIDDDWIRKNPVKLEFFGAHWLPGGIDVDHEIVKTLSKSFEEIMETRPIIEGSPWGTDGGYLSYHGIPAVVFGPGTTSLAHQVDESIEIEKIIDCAKVIAMTLVKFCHKN